jgi:hypothetical protein
MHGAMLTVAYTLATTLQKPPENEMNRINFVGNRRRYRFCGDNGCFYGSTGTGPSTGAQRTS